MESTSTTGTGTLSLGGAALQARSFVSGVGTGNRTCYCILSGNRHRLGNRDRPGDDRVAADPDPRCDPAKQQFGAAISLSGTSTVFRAQAPAASIIQPRRIS
jgi:hypothetical protein